MFLKVSGLLGRPKMVKMVPKWAQEGHNERRRGQEVQERRDREQCSAKMRQNEGCLERWRPLAELRPRTSRQHNSEPRPRGGVGEGLNPSLGRREKGFKYLKLVLYTL